MQKETLGPNDLLHVGTCLAYHDMIIVSHMKTHVPDINNLDRDMKDMLNIFNDSWANNWGFIPFTENEFMHLGHEMLQVVPAEHFKIAIFDGEPVGIIASLPNFNEIIKDLLNYTGAFQGLSLENR